MKLLDSLLDAIIRLEGDALVMHVGEKPYVVTASASMNAYRGPLAWGQVELSSRVLTFDAVSTMLGQILPVEQQHALDEFGAIEYELGPRNGAEQRFSVVAARGGEDVWIEVRRKPVEVAAPAAVQPEPAVEPAAPVAEPDPEPEPVAEPEPEPVAIAAEVNESIVVALPGDAAEEVRLSAVPDNAFQLVDDEPQDLPTEAEVDAMLAATASALLTSGLASEPDLADEPTIDHGAGYIESPDDDLPLKPLAPMTTAIAQPVATAVVFHEPAEPAFELSPPTAVALLDEPEPEEELTFVRPQGTPLFSEEAILAAAAPAPEAPTEPEVPIEAVEATAPVAASIEDAETVVPVPSVRDDLSAHVAVWSVALMEWSTGSRAIDVPPQHVGSPPPSVPGGPSGPPVSNVLNLRPEHAPPLSAGPVWTPSGELPMDATPEPRHHEPPALDHTAASSTVEAKEPSPPAPTPVSAESHQAVVVPLSRSQAKAEPLAGPFTPAEDAALMQTLRAAATRGASTVYVVAQSKPMIRVDGEIAPLEGEPTLSAADVERLVTELAPPRRRDALQQGPVEWLCDVPEVGRVRCLTFRDHRGPGVLFRMFPPRAISVEQLGLTAEVQALCQQSDGLVLVAGARASGKSTLLNAFVDLINRTRSEHLITIETQIGFVHESRRSFISQRETRGDVDLAAAFARAALHEDPDVIMIEDLKSPDLVAAALEAAESGRLVLASVAAASTIGAVERIIDVFPADRRPKARMSLASALRGVVAQVLLRRVKGGQVPAREILLNTPGVSTLVLEGKTFQLPVALESGRRHGMVPLGDSLAAHVRDGTVQAAEAYRRALDRAAFLAILKRDGIDTSFAERLA